jgi:HEAT repeat protein
MTQPEWREFLQRWSDEWLATDEHFAAKVRKGRWLGFSPATEAQIAKLEQRLGYPLPPSYRNFLLTTNGWLNTSMFIARVRPASKVEWLQSDSPELLDIWSPEDGEDRIANYRPAEYFAYDGRPIFDAEHFRKSIVIADAVAGDSMIYLLNPLVVATDGEWEAWRFANWIPGAERFPSFELLMRAEHELFSSKGHSQKFFGPYEGKYAPDQPRHAAEPIGPGRAKPRRRTVPELIAELESPSRAARLKAATHLLREFRPHDPDDEHPELVEPLSRILESDLESDVRSAAAAMLGSYGDSGAIEPLVKALGDESLKSITLSALLYLSLYMKDSRIADAMVRLLEMPQDMFITGQAVHILEDFQDSRVALIGLRLLDEAPFLFPRGVEVPDRSQAEAYHRSSVRIAGAFAFARFATDATPELVKRLDHSSAEVRAASVAALREDPKKGPHLAPRIAPLLNDPDPIVRQQATYTFRSLQPATILEIPPERVAELEAQVAAQFVRASRRKSRF